ncbi:hypothetical protein PENTCL1PPCAC_4122, partial [Pristionchus entomophagus]
SELFSHRERSGGRSGANVEEDDDDEGPVTRLPYSTGGIRYRAMDKNMEGGGKRRRRLLDSDVPPRPPTVARAARARDRLHGADSMVSSSQRLFSGNHQLRPLLLAPPTSDAPPLAYRIPALYPVS